MAHILGQNLLQRNYQHLIFKLLIINLPRLLTHIQGVTVCYVLRKKLFLPRCSIFRWKDPGVCKVRATILAGSFESVTNMAINMTIMKKQVGRPKFKSFLYELGSRWRSRAFTISAFSLETDVASLEGAGRT